MEDGLIQTGFGVGEVAVVAVILGRRIALHLMPGFEQLAQGCRHFLALMFGDEIVHDQVAFGTEFFEVRVCQLSRHIWRSRR